LALASGSAGFLSPFLDSDRITFCRVHGTGAIEEEQSALEASNGREFGASGRDADSLITRVLFSSDLRASAAARWACPVGRRRRPETTARRRRGRRSRRTWRGASCQRLPPRRPASKRNPTWKLLSVLLPFLPEERRRRNPLWARTKRIQPKFTPNSGSSVITRKTHGWWLSRVHVRRAGRERERERERDSRSGLRRRPPCLWTGPRRRRRSAACPCVGYGWWPPCVLFPAIYLCWFVVGRNRGGKG
jgi:hypothetical protein